jgi:hypothetical protein
MEAAEALAQMAVRGAKGDRKLAALVRERQDVLAEWQKRDEARTAAVSTPPEKRNKEADAENLRVASGKSTRAAGPGEYRMKSWIAVLLLLVAAPAVAQQHQHRHSPYAGSHTRDIKALSAQEAADLRAGRGMGLALATELNGYPGPLHVLELAESRSKRSTRRCRRKPWPSASGSSTKKPLSIGSSPRAR